MNKYDVAIIGNGVLGLSIAYALTNLDKNLKINIIGPSCNTGSASLASGAMINCFAEITDKTLTTHQGKEKFSIAYKALKAWDKWIDDLNSNISEKSNKIEMNYGTYVLLNADSGKLDSNNYYAIKQALIEYNEPFEDISDITDIPGINPLPTHRPLYSMFLPNEAYIDSNFYLTQLKNILTRKSNITFTNNHVKKINFKSNSISSALLDNNETIEASKFILANGAYAQNIIDQIPELTENTPYILAGMGYSVLLKQIANNPINHVIRTPNRSGACGLHALPRKNSLYVGATNNVFMLPQEKLKAGLINFLLKCAIEQLNQGFYNSEIEGFHVGNRPLSFDGFPLIGKTSMNNLWMVNGTYRDGFHQSPVIASEIANQVMGRGESQINEAFLPNRKLIRTMSRQESIDEFICHHIAGTFEHGTKLPGFMSVIEFEKMIISKMNNIYDKLDTDYGIIPEVLFMIDFAENQDELIAFFKNYLKKNS